MKVGCCTGGPVGSQVREFLQWAGGDVCDARGTGGLETHVEWS